MSFLLLIVLAAAGSVAGLWHLKREAERRAALFSFAASKGWEFDPIDRLGLAERWSVRPFGVGHSRRASNVLSGVVGGRSMLAFDYRYKVTTNTGRTRHTRTYRFGVCVLALPTYLPALEVTRENTITRLANSVGLDDIELESEDFNRAFRVRGAARFAHDVLTPRTMEMLLRSDCPSWRIAGTDILAWGSGYAGPVDVLSSLSTLEQVVRSIPDFVWKDHGASPPQ